MTPLPQDISRKPTVYDRRIHFRGPDGRIRAGTPAEKLAVDIREGTQDYWSERIRGGHPYQVYVGRRSRELFAIRKGIPVPLRAGEIDYALEQKAISAIRYGLRQFRRNSPVDTGLLRSRWQAAARNALVNDVPYLWDADQTSRKAGFIRRTELQILRHMGLDIGALSRLPRRREVTISW